MRSFTQPSLSSAILSVLCLFLSFSIARPATPDTSVTELSRRATAECDAGEILVGWHGTAVSNRAELLKGLKANANTAEDLQLGPGFYVAQYHYDAMWFGKESAKSENEGNHVVCAICAKLDGFKTISKVKVTTKEKWWKEDKLDAVNKACPGCMLVSPIDGGGDFIPKGDQFAATQAHITAGSLRANCAATKETELVTWLRRPGWNFETAQ